MCSAAARSTRMETDSAVEGFGFNGAAERGVDGVVGGDLKRGRGSHTGIGEEVEQRGVVLVDLAE